MASFVGVYQAYYVNGEVGPVPFVVLCTVTDGQSDSTFTVGEAVSVILPDGDSGLSCTFLGTTVVGGITFVVLKDVIDRTFVFGGTEPITFPNSLADLAIDQSAYTVCFLAGTAIATPAGPRPVEDLAIGDLVLTADGRAVPVRWVGVQTVVTLFADPLRSFPVRIAAGALGEGLPHRDLFVSPDHAFFLDGVLVQAGALVNGTTIARVTEMPERFTYFHVELDDHSLILAEGVPAETFVDNVTRRRFDNFAEYEALYGEAASMLPEMDLPRIKSARQLPAGLRARLSADVTAPRAA